jgi:serine/threonine protein kinase
VLEMATKEYPYSECRTIVGIMKAVQTLTQPRCLGLVTTNDLAVDFVTQSISADPTTRPSALELEQHEFLKSDQFDEVATIESTPGSGAGSGAWSDAGSGAGSGAGNSTASSSEGGSSDFSASPATNANTNPAAAAEEALAAEVASRASIEAPNGPNSSPSLEAQAPTPTAAHSPPASGATEAVAVGTGAATALPAVSQTVESAATVASVLAEADLGQYGELGMHATPPCTITTHYFPSYPPTSPPTHPSPHVHLYQQRPFSQSWAPRA